MIRELQDGLGYVSQGFNLAKTPKLRPYMVVPLIANVLLFGISAYLVVYYAFNWIDSWAPNVDFWSWLDWLETYINDALSALKWAIFIAIILLLLFVMGSTFTMFTHTLVGPFIGILGEKAEKELHTIRYPEQTLAQIAARSIVREFRKLIYWLVRALGLGILSLILWFIPAVNAAVPVIWFLFGSWIMAMQYIDVPADNNGKSFDEVLILLKQNRVAAMSFGAIIMALTSIPIVNLFIIPVAVCGGVVFWVKKIEKNATH